MSATLNWTRLTTSTYAILLVWPSRVHLSIIPSESGVMLDLTTDILSRLFLWQTVRWLGPITIWISLRAHNMGGKLVWASGGWREKRSLLCSASPTPRSYAYLPNSLFSSLQNTLIGCSAVPPGHFQCPQRPFTGGSVDSVFVSFRRSQAHHQVNSVPIIQDTLKDNGVYLGHLRLSLIILFRSSIEATGDDPVTLHDRHNRPDFVTIDMAPLPTLPSQVANNPAELRKNHSHISNMALLLATSWPITGLLVYSLVENISLILP